jgi:phenylacetate-CoA ligase
MSAIALSERIYPHLPVFLQNAACWNYGRREANIRFGKSFDSRLASLLNTERLSESEIRAYQDNQISQLISHAYENVPYYRELMTGLRLAPDDIRCVADLQKLPVLTKETVRQNFERLVSRKANVRDLVARHTSGTSGKALHFYSGKDAIAFQWAVWWRHRIHSGVNFDSWHANFTGKLAVPPGQTAPPYWRWNRPMRQALLNMHHLTPSKIRDVVDFLNNHDFTFYFGYPSIIHMLAVNAREAGLFLTSRPRVVFTGAEHVNEWQRRDIQEFTGATLTDHWGLSEGCGNASRCSDHVYHEDFEFGVLECVDPQPCGDGRVRGKIICTGFANPDFPFIRYDTGDTGTWETSELRCSCGNQSRALAGVEGRTEDYVITPEGARIMRFDYVFKDTVNVKEAQVVQERLGAIKMRIVKRAEYGILDERFIASEIKRWISPRLEINFEYVDEIERENSGKFKAVKSRLQPDQIGREALRSRELGEDQLSGGSGSRA